MKIPGWDRSYKIQISSVLLFKEVFQPTLLFPALLLLDIFLNSALCPAAGFAFQEIGL